MRKRSRLWMPKSGRGRKKMTEMQRARGRSRREPTCSPRACARPRACAARSHVLAMSICQVVPVSAMRPEADQVQSTCMCSAQEGACR